MTTTIDNVYGGLLIQRQLALPPSKLDIRQTKQLLKDFYIVADIPQFITRGALLSWRKQMITDKLEEWTV